MNNENIQHTINATDGERQLSIVGNNFKETDEVAKDDGIPLEYLTVSNIDRIKFIDNDSTEKFRDNLSYQNKFHYDMEKLMREHGVKSISMTIDPYISLSKLKELLSEPLVVEFEKKDNLITRLISRFPDSKLISETHLLFNYNDKQFGIHIDDSKIYNISELDSKGLFKENLEVIWKEDLSGIERFETNSLIPYELDSNISVDELLEMIK